jgi:hypothetical protein
VKSYEPQYADKYSYQGGGFYELDIPGSNPKIVKMCSREEATNLRTVLRFLEEHQLLSDVKQYLILPEFICDKPPCFYVMDKAPGEDFNAFNTRFYGGVVDKDTYLQVHRLLGQSFAFLHNHGIFHWDPHASNVFVSGRRITIVDNDEICIEPQDKNEKKHIHDFKTLVLKTIPFSAYVVSKYKPDRTQKGLPHFPLAVHLPYEDLFEAVAVFMCAYFQGVDLPDERRSLFIRAVMDEIEKYVGVLSPSALAAIERELLSCLP